jgi:Glycosyl hydrolase family 26
MAISRGRLAGLAAVLVLALGGAAGLTLATASWHQSSAAPDGTVTASEGPAVPAHGAYFGARVRGNAYTESAEIAGVDRLQQSIGRRLAIVHVYHMWSDPFPSSSDLAFLRQGSTLLLSWSGTDTLAIIAGHYDQMIRQRALAIKATGKPIFLEWRWEMDRSGLQAQVHSPADYIKAWDHIRSIFAQEHVTNVGWVWCPTASGFATGQAAAYYPGNNEVDWVCADAYPGYGPYRSFANVVAPFLSWASHHPKPVMIGEYGVPTTYGTQQRAQWLWDAAHTVQSDPQIKALVYFDADAKRAYSLHVGSPALEAFRRIAHLPYFNPAGQP